MNTYSKKEVFDLLAATLSKRAKPHHLRKPGAPIHPQLINYYAKRYNLRIDINRYDVAKVDALIQKLLN